MRATTWGSAFAGERELAERTTRIVLTCTHFDSIQPDAEQPVRQVVLVEAESADDLVALPLLPSKHFVSFVVWDAPPRTDVLVTLAQALLDAGAVYVCAFGDNCELVHDAVDSVIVTTGREPDDDHAILTTWHGKDTLDDALWYALFTAVPAPAYKTTCCATVIFAIDAGRHLRTLRQALSDPEAFSRAVLATTLTDSPRTRPRGAPCRSWRGRRR